MSTAATLFAAMLLISSLPFTSTAAHADNRQLHATKDGTAFAVNPDGEFITNYHVVKGCPVVHLQWDGNEHDASVLASDEQNDLAVVRVSGSQIEPLKFREGKGIRPGDGIVALGFPYSGLLSTSAQVTTGDVSALSGVGDDIRFLQLTAPVQPGNSGGPLLDLSGNVVGIVSKRINDLVVAKVTGSLPQNINFAIKSSVIRTFLEAHQIAYETAPSSSRLEPADVAEAAAKSTLLLECFGEAVREASATPAPSPPEFPSATFQKPEQMPTPGTATVCGRPVTYTIDRSNDSALLGIWTGVWNNASKICGGIIVQKVNNDGSVQVIYVYGPSSSHSSFPWKEQTVVAQISGDTITFVDGDGNTFIFEQEGSTLLHGAFSSRAGRLYSSFERAN